jgi:hypothetical protein
MGWKQRDCPTGGNVLYTVEVCNIFGTLYGELGRAMTTSQRSTSGLNDILDKERTPL